MSTKAYGITSGGVIKCGRVALIPASRGMRSTAGWALFHCVESGWHLVRELSDEIQSESRMREIRTSGLMSGERKRATASRPRTAPFLDSTRRSAHLARIDNLLRSLLLAPGDTPCHGRRYHPAPHRRMDGADGSKCCGRGRRHSASGPLCITRSRHQILQFLSNYASVRRSSAGTTAAAQSKFECVRRAMGPLHQARVLIEVDPVW